MERERKQMILYQEDLQKNEKLLETSLSDLQTKYSELLSAQVHISSNFCIILIVFLAESIRKTKQRTQNSNCITTTRVRHQ